MDRSTVIDLISITKTQDAFGVWRQSESKKTVYAQVDSVSMSEFFEGGRNGLNPELKFTMFFGDYNDEPIVVYKNNRYSVYRTYHRRTDEVELYVERKGGTVTPPTTTE